MAKVYKGGEFLVSEGVSEDIYTTEDFSDEQRAIAETTEQNKDTGQADIAQ